MIGPASNLPVGLLGLLGIRNDGQYPNAVQESITPVVDLWQFLSANVGIELLTGSNTTAVTGVVFMSIGGVPAGPVAGEYWFVRGFSIYANSGAAELIRFKAGVSRNLAAGYQPFLQGGVSAYSSATDAAGAGSAYAPGPSGILLSPGDVMTAQVERITTAATIQLNLAASVYRFRP